MRKRFALLMVMLACALAMGLAACGNTHAITLDAEDYSVQSCPKRAKEGDVVRVETSFVCDADLYVSVDGDKEFGQFASDGAYEFTMPDHDVCVRVWIVSNGLA